MASGVEICDKVKELFSKMKVVKTEDDSNSRVRVAIFTIKNDKIISIHQTFEQKDMGDSSGFSIISNEMDKNYCFYALYDCNFETKDGVNKDDLVFLTWTSDCAAIKHKMIYASSKQNLKGCMRGVKHDLQLNDRSDWTRQAIAGKIQDNTSWDVAKIEGVAV